MKTYTTEHGYRPTITHSISRGITVQDEWEDNNGPQWLAVLGFLTILALGMGTVTATLMYALFRR